MSPNIEGFKELLNLRIFEDCLLQLLNKYVTVKVFAGLFLKKRYARKAKSGTNIGQFSSVIKTPKKIPSCVNIFDYLSSSDVVEVMKKDYEISLQCQLRQATVLKTLKSFACQSREVYA